MAEPHTDYLRIGAEQWGTRPRNPFRRDLIVTEQTLDRWHRTMILLGGRIKSTNPVLDLGPENGLGVTVARVCGVPYVCTGAQDLDTWSGVEPNSYDYICAFDILEHLFNPLHVLLHCRRALKPWGSMFVTVPRRPHFLRFDGHWHEFDDYHWQSLITRAGFKIICERRFRMKRKIRGPRGLLRYFCERVRFCELRLER